MERKRYKKIFIIDDDVIYQELLKIELALLDEVELTFFTSAEASLERLHEEPDLVILDLFLNHDTPSGWSSQRFLEYVRGNHASIKVVMISGSLNEGILWQRHSVDFL